jgi:septal ring factor EnvC (AmiA/AmiB activator)
VYINTNGQLGTLTSSRRFKDNIQDMGTASSKLFQLRPVTFNYKPQFDDGSHLLQYGLIAEEVAKVYPDMVVYDKDGQPYTVRYQVLAPMLLNELQKQNAVVAAQQESLRTQQQRTDQQQGQIQTLQRQNEEIQQRLSRLETLLVDRAQ